MLEEIKQHVIVLEEQVHHMSVELAAQNLIFYAVTMTSMLVADDPEHYLSSIRKYADEVYDKAKSLPMADELQASLDQKFADLQLAFVEYQKRTTQP